MPNACQGCLVSVDDDEKQINQGYLVNDDDDDDA